jgi:TPR repeat protein
MAVEPSPMIRQREADQQQLAMTSPTAAKDENQKSGGVPVPATAIAPLRRDGSAVAPNETIGATTSAVARLDPIDEPDLAQLVRRGTNLMAIGDVSAARLMFQQAAEAGSAGAAFALAETYDPAASKRQTSSLDIALARNWYEKARVLGAPTAEERLARLTQPQR